MFCRGNEIMEVIKLQCINAFKTLDHAFLHPLRCRTQIFKALSTEGKCHIYTIFVHGCILPWGGSTCYPPYGCHWRRASKKIGFKKWQHRSRGRCLILIFGICAVRPRVATGPRLLPRRVICIKYALICFSSYPASPDHGSCLFSFGGRYGIRPKVDNQEIPKKCA